MSMDVNITFRPNHLSNIEEIRHKPAADAVMNKVSSRINDCYKKDNTDVDLNIDKNEVALSYRNDPSLGPLFAEYQHLDVKEEKDGVILKAKLTEEESGTQTQRTYDYEKNEDGTIYLMEENYSVKDNNVKVISCVKENNNGTLTYTNSRVISKK